MNIYGDDVDKDVDDGRGGGDILIVRCPDPRATYVSQLPQPSRGSRMGVPRSGQSR